MERNALDLVGGFDAYQNKIYTAVVEKLKDMTVGKVIRIEEGLRRFRTLTDGLEGGLLELLKIQRPLTSDNVKDLSGPLDLNLRELYDFSLIGEDRAYWKQKATEFAAPGLKITPEMAAHLTIVEESDAIIAQRKVENF